MGEDRSDRVRLGMQPFPMTLRGCCLKKIQVGCQIWFLERPLLEHRNGQKRSRAAVSAAPRSPDGDSLDRRYQDTDGNLAQAQHHTNMYARQTLPVRAVTAPQRRAYRAEGYPAPARREA